MAVNLSRAQLLNFQQCRRRFWLEQYHPELEGDVEPMDRHLDAEEAADAAAREIWPGEKTKRINGRLGLRKAIEQTDKELASGAVVFDATFEFQGVSVQVDVLDWSEEPYRAVSATAATQLTQRHIEDCAIQAWAMRGLNLPEHRFFVALTDSPDHGDATPPYARFSLVDVTEQIEPENLDATVEQARADHASLQEPQATMGSQCREDYPCPFLRYCESQ
jgi:hypothetical protein